MSSKGLNHQWVKRETGFLSRELSKRIVDALLTEVPQNVDVPERMELLITYLLNFSSNTIVDYSKVLQHFVSRLADVVDDLRADAQFIWENDPAATCVQEVVITYPGFYAILHYRLANLLHQLGVQLLPRMLTEYAHSKTGIDIHPAAKIGREFFIDHGTGIVIGGTAIIGNRVKLYQGVTLGALSVSKQMAVAKRHPTIEDDVVIYAGSTVLGGDTIIGHHSIIGGNVWLVKSVPPYSIVYHESKVRVQSKFIKS